MKAKTILLSLVVLLKLLDVNAQYQRNTNLNQYRLESSTTPSYRMQYEDPKTGKFYPDSTLFLMWNLKVAKWDTVRLILYTYGNNNNTTSQVAKVLDSTGKKFIISYKTDYTYNKFNKCDEELTQSLTHKGWENSSRIVRTYDSESNCTETLSQRVDTSGWVNDSRELWEYDSYGNLITNYVQNWLPDGQGWATISDIREWEYAYDGNRLVWAKYHTYYSPPYYSYTYEYKLQYKNDESEPAKVIYDERKISYEWGSYHKSSIYGDLLWKNGFQTDKIFSIETEADYIRRDSTDDYFSTRLHNAKKRTAFYNNGLKVRDTIFNWDSSRWAKIYINSFYYNKYKKPILEFNSKYNSSSNLDTEYVHQIDYDLHGNIILDMGNWPLQNYFQGNRYTFMYNDTTNQILSLTTERYNQKIAEFEFTTKEIYYPCQQIVDIKEKQNANTPLIFPNPASDNVNIYLDADRKYSVAFIQISDLNGKIIIEKQIKPFNHISEIINISALKDGMYFLILNLDNSRHYLKLIKK